MDEQLFSFGYWVRRRRKALDLTQETLAQRVACAVVMIKKIELDERRPSAQLAERLAEQLALPPAVRLLFSRVARTEISVDQLPSPITLRMDAVLLDDGILAAETPLIDRERELATIAAWVRVPHRLITLVGPPGVGKTRLALAVAVALRPSFAAGIVTVSLASVRNPALVLATIAGALGVHEAGSRPLFERLCVALADQQRLLVLDNFEQVVTSAPLLTQLLAICPRLQLLVTSREALRLRDEIVFAVPPLVLPTVPDVSDVLTEPGAIADSPAVTLFVARARAIAADFTLTAQNARAVAAICCRLDGLPLAIELAAARISLLDPGTLLIHLTSATSGMLRLLTHGARDLPSRHQTLQRAIAWSYDLLPADEQALFRHLSVFAGGWTINAATAIWAAPIKDADMRELSVLNLLNALIARNLLYRIPTADGLIRLTMLETVRAFAVDCLRTAGEEEFLREQHARYYCTLATQAIHEPHDASRAIGFAQLEREYDNVREALDWTCGLPAPRSVASSKLMHGRDNGTRLQIAARLTRALVPFWLLRGYLSEGRHWLEMVLARLGAQTSLVQGDLLRALGECCYHQGDLAAARTHARASLAWYRAQEDHIGIAWALYGLGVAHDNHTMSTILLTESLMLFRQYAANDGAATALNALGFIDRLQGDYDRASTAHSESLALYEHSGDISGQGWSHALLGKVLANQGKYAIAQEHYTTSITCLRTGGNRMRLAWALQGLGEVELWQDRVAAARDSFTACLAQFKALGDQTGIGWACYNVGRTALTQGDVATAQSQFTLSLHLFHTVGDYGAAAWVLTALGRVAHHMGEPQRAHAYYRESLILHNVHASRHGLACTLEGLAEVAYANTQFANATRLWAGATVLRKAISVPMPPRERRDYARYLVLLHTLLADADFNRVWTEGQVRVQPFLSLPNDDMSVETFLVENLSPKW